MSEKAGKSTGLERKIAAYSVAAGAAVALYQSADADIIYSGATNLNVTLGSPVQIDLDGGGALDVTFSLFRSFITSIPASGKSLNIVAAGSNGFASALSVRNFSAGQNIGSINTFVTTATGYLAQAFHGPASAFYGGQFINQQGYVGVQFSIGPSTHYGWIDYEANADATQGTIHGWGYEDTAGGSIPAGATSSIPEPGSLTLLALGAAGLYSWRKGREETEAAG